MYLKYDYLPIDTHSINHNHEKVRKMTILGQHDPLLPPGAPPGAPPGGGAKIKNCSKLLRKDAPVPQSRLFGV